MLSILPSPLRSHAQLVISPVEPSVNCTVITPLPVVGLAVKLAVHVGFDTVKVPTTSVPLEVVTAISLDPVSAVILMVMLMVICVSLSTVKLFIVIPSPKLILVAPDS